MDILKSFLPEIYFSFAIFSQLIFNSWVVNEIKFNFPILYKEITSQVFFIFITLIFLFYNLKIEGIFFNSLFIVDSSSYLLKILIVIINCFAFIFILKSVTLESINSYEYFTIFLLSNFALFLLINVTDLLSAYLLVELQALCFYVLASFKRNSSFSTEAGLKYFIAGSFISGIYLMGVSLIYLSLGTFNFNNIACLLFFDLFDSEFTFFTIFCELGILLVTFSLLFKLTAAPFQFWAPDVYEGSPLSSTIIFSIIPKISLFVFFNRWIFTVSSTFIYTNYLIIFFAILSVFLGAFFAIRQKRIKRFILYSSLAQVGFLLVPFFLINSNCIASLYFFLIIYLITSILIWGNLVGFYESFKNYKTFLPNLVSVFHISNLAGLSKINKLQGLSFLIIFFSVSGIPPFAGFLAKILIVFHLLESNEILIAVILFVLNMISVYYYLRVIKIIYFEDKTLKQSNLIFQMNYNSFLSGYSEMTLVVLLILLGYIFFDPTLFYLCSQYFAIAVEVI
jgi:NADH-quinone oxidoreductase subunit N